MKRDNLEHIIRASSVITNDAIIVIGSQAMLGSFSEPPEEIAKSMGVDVYALSDDGMSKMIDDAIGEDTIFHESYGYYARGVSSETAVLPDGWMDRLIDIRLEKSVGYCLSPEDITVSKIIAGREKDIEYVKCLINHKMIKFDLVEQLINNVIEKNKSEEIREKSVLALNKFKILTSANKTKNII